MDTEGADVSIVVINEREITVTELLWGFPRREGKPTACVEKIATVPGVYSELLSDFWLGCVVLPSCNDSLQTITIQLTCDGNCANEQACSPMIAQYDAKGSVIARIYSDPEYRPRRTTTDTTRAKDGQHYVPMGWWRMLLRRVTG